MYVYLELPKCINVYGLASLNIISKYEGIFYIVEMSIFFYFYSIRIYFRLIKR